MKTVLKAILLVGIVAYLVWAVVQYAQPTEKQVCADVRVSVKDSSSRGVVTEDYVHSLLGRKHIFPKGMCLSDISLRGLDSLVAADPYISKASCHFTSAGILCIDVVPRKPILHVIQADGDEYYVTDDGDFMRADLAEQGLCLATGNMKRAYVKSQLLPLVRYIYHDKFWNAQIEQIYVDASGHVELVPRVGKHIVEFGSADKYRDKLHRLQFFYRYGMPKVGWNKYKTISLAYEGQVVCSK